MQIIRISSGREAEQVDSIEELPADGFTWLDFVRDDAPDWRAEVRRLTGFEVYDAHVIDSLNEGLPSIYEFTESYEMLVFRGLASSEVDSFTTKPTAFFVFSNLLVTIRSEESISVGTVAQRLLARAARAPRNPAELMLRILNAMVDRFLAMREPLARLLETWQEALLDPKNPFEDWMSLMRHRNRLRRLEQMCEEQLESVNAWRAETSTELDGPMTVRVNDLSEHIRRVLANAQHMEAQLESLVQIHFAAVAHRTNDVMRVLTVLAAVFLPLTLVAGIFGMNFEHMPELKLRYAYFVTLASMLILALGMLYVFRRKRWI
ncbi:MAG: magnesium transporter CorA family protein [Planctomycetota bacterium]|jgi:magnesium/cobalt transport protein CorA